MCHMCHLFEMWPNVHINCCVLYGCLYIEVIIYTCCHISISHISMLYFMWFDVCCLYVVICVWCHMSYVFIYVQNEVKWGPNWDVKCVIWGNMCVVIECCSTSMLDFMWFDESTIYVKCAICMKYVTCMKCDQKCAICDLTLFDHLSKLTTSLYMCISIKLTSILKGDMSILRGASWPTTWNLRCYLNGRLCGHVFTGTS